MSSYRVGSAVQCARCGNVMEPSSATYDKGGHLICRSCAARAMIAEGDQRAIGSLITSAFAVPALGVLSWTCLNQLALVSFVTLASGIGWIVMIGRADEHRRQMGGKFVPCLVAVIVGMLLATGPLLVLAASILFGIRTGARH